MFVCARPKSYGSGGRKYTAEAAALFAAMDVKPNSARARLIDNAIISLKSAGVWSGLDGLQVYAAADSQAGRVDWKLPTRVAAAISSPTFTADVGFATNGTTSYIDTNMELGALTNFTRNTGVFGIHRTSTGVTAGSIGGTFTAGGGSTTIRPRSSTTDKPEGRLNGNTGVSGNGTGYGAGLFSLRRSSSSTVEVYYNGTLDGSGASTSEAIAVGTARVGSINNSSFQAVTTNYCYCGNLTGAQIASLYTIMNTYLTQVGAV